MNEFKARGRNTMPEKPEYLVLFDLVRAMKMPLAQGGILDQPCIWLALYSMMLTDVEMIESMMANKG